MAFAVTKMDYIIFLAALGVFLFFLIFVDFRYDPMIYEHLGYNLSNMTEEELEFLWRTEPVVKLSVPFFICPIVALHRIWIMLWGDSIPRLRDVNKRLFIGLQVQKIKDKFKEGMDEYYEWKKRK